jgi:hypothetical protein
MFIQKSKDLRLDLIDLTIQKTDVGDRMLQFKRLGRKDRADGLTCGIPDPAGIVFTLTAFGGL